ncbi:MAG: hypothetical protein V9G08_02310 [Dermatophilaceae bacterium]
MADQNPARWEVRGSAALMGAILIAFLGAVAFALFTTSSPPLIADAPSTAPPVLYCDGRALPTQSLVPLNSSSSSPALSTPSVTATTPAAGAFSTPSTSAPAVTIVPCDVERLAYAPQLRGGYDSNARLVALLAVVTPFLTTLVAFYFGQKAGQAGAASGVVSGIQQGRVQLASEIQHQAVNQPDMKVEDLSASLRARGLVK